VTIQDFKANATSAAQGIPDNPGWTVERNAVGNFMILDANGTYCGYIDFKRGEVEIFTEADNLAEG